MPSPVVRRDIRLRLGGGIHGEGLRGLPSQASNSLTQLPPELTPPRRRRRARDLPPRLSIPGSDGGKAFISVRRGEQAGGGCLETRSLPPPSPTRDDLADDLGAYITDLKARRDEDGRPVVFFPENYEDVLSVMSRADLLLGPHPLRPAAGQPAPAHENPQQPPRQPQPPHKSWTHYVLEDGLPGGNGQRQATDDDEEQKDDVILRGLARIKQLDLQLQAKAREERSLRLQAAGEVEALRQDLSSLIQSMHWDSIPRKAFFTEHRHTPYSHQPSSSTSRAGGDDDDCSPLPTSRTTMSDVVNGRTTFLTDGARDHYHHGERPSRIRTPTDEDLHLSGSPRSGLTSSRSSKAPSSSSTRQQQQHRRAVRAAGGRDFIRQNIELSKAGFRTHLTHEDECRYRALLQGLLGDDDEEAGGEEAWAGSTSALAPEQHAGPETEEGQQAPPPPPQAAAAAAMGASLSPSSPTPSSSTRGSGAASSVVPSYHRHPRGDYGLSDFERERLRQIDSELQQLPSSTSISTATEARPLEERSVWDEALDSLGDGASTTTFRSYLRDERERRQAELRLTQIDSMLHELHRIAPLPSAPPSTPGGVSSRLPSHRADQSPLLPPSPSRPRSAARSEAADSIASHSARSVRRPVTMHDIEVVLSDTKRSLGSEEPSLHDRERVVELLKQLKAMGICGGGPVLDSDSLLKRVSSSIEKTRQSVSSHQAMADNRACWAAASMTSTATGASPPASPGAQEHEARDEGCGADASICEFDRTGTEEQDGTVEDEPPQQPEPDQRPGQEALMSGPEEESVAF